MRSLALILLLLAPLLVSFDLRKKDSRDSVVPGLSSDGRGNDLTLDYLLSIREPAGLPRSWTTIYFASGTGGTLAQGDDTGKGTLDEPLYSAALIEDYLNRPYTIVIVDGDYILDGASDPMFGFTGWDTTHSDCGSEPYCSYLLPYNLEDPPVFSCENIAEITGITSATFLYNTGRILLGGIIIKKCPLTPHGFPNIIAGIRSSGDTARLALLGTQVLDSSGWIVYTVRAESGILEILNAEISSRNYADFNSNCVGPQCHSSLCSGSGAPFFCCQAGSPSLCLGTPRPIGADSHATTLIGGSQAFQSQEYAVSSGPMCVFNNCIGNTTGCDFTGIATRCMAPATVNASASNILGTSAYVNNSPFEGRDTHFYLARSIVYPVPSTLFPFYGAVTSSVTESTTEFNETDNEVFYQNTFTGVHAPFRISELLAGDTANLEAQCNLFEDIHQVASNAYLFAAVQLSGPNAGTHNIDIDGTNLYDTDDGGSNPDSFVFEGAEYKTAASISRSDPTNGASPGYTLNSDFYGSVAGGAEGSLESGGAGVDGDAFGGLAQPVCNVADCINQCPVTRLIPLPIPLSTRIIGGSSNLSSLLLGTHYKNVGAQ